MGAWLFKSFSNLLLFCVYSNSQWALRFMIIVEGQPEHFCQLWDFLWISGRECCAALCSWFNPIITISPIPYQSKGNIPVQQQHQLKKAMNPLSEQILDNENRIRIKLWHIGKSRFNMSTMRKNAKYWFWWASTTSLHHILILFWSEKRKTGWFL